MISRREERKAKDHCIAQACLKGYDGNPKTTPPHIYNSDLYCAYRLGQHLKAIGRAKPHTINKGLGKKWRINLDEVYTYIGQTIEFENIYPDKSFRRLE
jgi:hypothetical protein